MRNFSLYQFIDKDTLKFVYSSSDLDYLRNMKKILSDKYKTNYLLVEVL